MTVHGAQSDSSGPGFIRCDNGPEFIANAVQELLADANQVSTSESSNFFDRYLYIKVGFELFFKFFDYTLENLIAHWTRRVRPFAHRFKLFNKTLKNLAKNPRLEVPDLA